MLTSLFGDLMPARPGRHGDGTDGEDGFAATRLLESVATAVNDKGQLVDRHHSELVVTGSPAQAIRDHFAASRPDLSEGTRQITLFDPLNVWASAVVRALSDAGGRPIERMHLREQTTLRTLATIERTTLVRRDEETLKIYHADVRAPGPENAEIPLALMERSQMVVVIVGPMQLHAVDAMLTSLLRATQSPPWHCAHLVFMLPPGADWIDRKISNIPWPAQLQLQVLGESLTSASSVWNAMLGAWGKVRGHTDWSPTGAGAEPLIRVADLPGAPRVPTPLPAHAPASLPPLDLERGRRTLHELLSIEGLLGCAIAEAGSGLVLAREAREGQTIDLAQAAAAAAQILRVHRQASRQLGVGTPVEEIVTSGALRQQVLRTISGRPELFVFALLDKRRASLALARFKLLDAEKSLA